MTTPEEAAPPLIAPPEGRPIGDMLRPATSRLYQLIEPVLPGPHMVLALVLLAALLARIGWLDRPDDALIFDEAYYVNAARVLLDIDVPDDGHYAGSEAGIDPNREHPPLGKLMIAGSMQVFGDNPVGWRFPSIVAGMLSVLLVYGIVRAAGGDEWMGVLAAALLALENLSLVHSRIGTLDMTMTALMLAGAWCYLRGWPLAAGVACAAAALIKLIGLYALAALVFIELFLFAKAWLETGKLSRKALLPTGKMIASFVVVWLVGLSIMDAWVTNFGSPLQHLDYILQYSFALTREGGPANQESQPWQWLVNEVPMTYMRVDEQIVVGEETELVRAIVYFRGAMNPVIIGAAPIALGLALYRAWHHDDRLALWTVAWFAATFLPFVPASMLADRITYIFYAVPIIPSFVIGLALLMRRGKLPAIVLWGFLIAVVIGFVAYYPIRRF